MKQDKLCALTFDDGPDAVKTPLVLDKLERYGVPATFFMIGRRIVDSARPAIDRVVSSGCEIGNHSWDTKRMDAMSPEEIRESIAKTDAAIKRFAGIEPTFFRPPNLAVSDVLYETVSLPFAGGIAGMDWAGCNTSAADRARIVLESIQNGAIILLHDVQPNPHPTPEALDILIPELKRRGYECVTLSELFRRKNREPATRKILWKYVE